jgi:hypothetical protein
MAQIPQDFNGMITFMNVKNGMGQQASPGEEDAFKKTGGSMMQGTMISMTGSNHNSQGSGGGNNSIIMLRSESNTFGGSPGSPMSTQ